VVDRFAELAGEEIKDEGRGAAERQHLERWQLVFYETAVSMAIEFSPLAAIGSPQWLFMQPIQLCTACLVGESANQQNLRRKVEFFIA